MRFWELVSVCRTEPQLLQRLSADPAWAPYLAWTDTFDALVRTGDRSTLDTELPDEACLHVLGGSARAYYVADGFVRTRRRDGTDQSLTAAEVFSRYGGGLLEDVNEAGLAAIPPAR